MTKTVGLCRARSISYFFYIILAYPVAMAVGFHGAAFRSPTDVSDVVTHCQGVHRDGRRWLHRAALAGQRFSSALAVRSAPNSSEQPLSTSAFRKCFRTTDDVDMARGEKKKSVDIINGRSKGLKPPGWKVLASADSSACFDCQRDNSEHLVCACRCGSIHGTLKGRRQFEPVLPFSTSSARTRTT